MRSHQNPKCGVGQYPWASCLGSIMKSALKKRVDRGAESGLTVVFERRLLSPSIQTSMGYTWSKGQMEKGELRTFCLDLIALIKSEIGSKKFVVVFVGQGHDKWGIENSVGGPFSTLLLTFIFFTANDWTISEPITDHKPALGALAIIYVRYQMLRSPFR